MAWRRLWKGIISLSSKSTAILTAIMSNSASHFGGRNGFTGGANSFPGGAIAPPRYIVKKGTGTFNCLPSHLRQSNLSISQFKCGLFKYYQKLVQEVYANDVPQTFKTVCVKCHLCRPLSSLSVKLCCH
jgi:hypothetical protein